MTSTSILAPASVKSMEGFLRSKHQKPLQSNFPPLKSVLVIYDIICGNLFSFVTSTNKVATTFCHILWIYYEILTLKNLTSSNFLVKYYKSILRSAYLPRMLRVLSVCVVCDCSECANCFVMTHLEFTGLNFGQVKSMNFFLS